MAKKQNKPVKEETLETELVNTFKVLGYGKE